MKHLTYNGSKLGMLGAIKGPDNNDKFWVVDHVDYDGETNTSRVTFHQLSSEELEDKFNERFEAELSG